MGFLNKSPERVPVEVIKSTHGQTFVSWPMGTGADGQAIPALPIGPQHPKSRHWVMADRTVVINLPGDPQTHPGGVIRHIFEAVSSTWNGRTKTLTTTARHPSNTELEFVISTSGVGCACTQGQAGNAGPIAEPYKLVMVNSSLPEFDWYEVIIP